MSIFSKLASTACGKVTAFCQIRADLKLCNDKGTMYSPFAQFHLNIFEPFFFSPAAESSSAADNDPPSTDSDLLLMDQAHDEYEQKGELRMVSKGAFAGVTVWKVPQF